MSSHPVMPYYSFLTLFPENIFHVRAHSTNALSLYESRVHPKRKI